MKYPLDKAALDQLFVKARTHNGWADTSVTDGQVQAIYDLMKMGATSANCCPARLVFVRSDEAKDRLIPHLMDGNKAKVKAAPVTVIIGNDLAFADKLGELFPHDPTAPSWFEDEEVRDITAMRNGTLQGAYLMLAARAIGLDCGPMSGFDNDAVDAEFFAGTDIKSNFICSIGVGTDENLYPRSPRLSFEDAATIL